MFGKPKEIILFYPGLYAIAVHRFAHVLYELDVPFIPRIMSEYAHTKTWIDINPLARIGRAFRRWSYRRARKTRDWQEFGGKPNRPRRCTIFTKYTEQYASFFEKARQWRRHLRSEDRQGGGRGVVGVGCPEDPQCRPRAWHLLF